MGAKKRGARFGRPAVPIPDNFLETVCSYKRKQISLPDALRRTNLKQATFYVLMRDLLRSFSSETPTDPPAPCTAAATDEPDYAPESLPAVIADGLPTDHARARVN